MIFFLYIDFPNRQKSNTLQEYKYSEGSQDIISDTCSDGKLTLPQKTTHLFCYDLNRQNYTIFPFPYGFPGNNKLKLKKNYICHKLADQI